MNELDQVRDALGAIREERIDLVSALIQADKEINRAETQCEQYRDALEISNTRADIYDRRCQIAIAILRDDESGLTQDRLRKIAAIIWPSPELATDKPTQIMPSVEAELLHIAFVSLRELLNLLPTSPSTRQIECDECGHTQGVVINPSVELGGLKYQIDSLMSRAKELLSSRYGRSY